MIPAEARVVVVGATGAVGREALSILASRGHPAGSVVALASARSAGARAAYGAGSVGVSEAGDGSFRGADVALLCSTGAVSRALAPAAVRAGALVVDNSSAFRMDENTPLIVPEVNGEDLGSGDRLVANPNCSTIILLVGLTPLRRAFGVEAIEVCTYQAVSGAGAAAIEELREQTRAWLEGREAPAGRVFREPCAFNVFSHDSAVDAATGLNGEEEKIIRETRKVWRDERVLVSPTCVRAPVERAHLEAVGVTLSRAASEEEVRGALAGAPGVEVVNDRAGNRFPTPRGATGRDVTLVGRIRPDPAFGLDGDGRTRRWRLFVCADQLRKGAALNAIQIADLALSRGGRARRADGEQGGPLAAQQARGGADGGGCGAAWRSRIIG